MRPKALRNLLLSGSFVIGASGCYSVPKGRQAVDAISVSGNSAVGVGAVEDRIATAPSPRFLGLFRGLVFEYKYYDKFVVQRDVERVERFYKARGYYDAEVKAARVVPTSAEHVRVEIEVKEGEPVRIDSVAPSGLDGLPFDLQAKILDSIQLSKGEIFDEEIHETAKSRIQTELTNRGYAWAQVQGRVRVDLTSHLVKVVYLVSPGPRCVIGRVYIRGLGEIPEAPVRRALHLRPGKEFSTDALESGKRALLDLGVFSNVDITWPARPQMTDAESKASSASEKPRELDISVDVAPSLLRTVKVGIGGELDVIRADIHGILGWESRNFLGNLRRFSLTWKPGVVLFPTVLPTLEKPTNYIPETRIKGELRQPGLFEARTGGILRGEFSIYPILLRPVNRDVILGYKELKTSIGLDRSFFKNHFYAASFFNLQANFPFTYKGPLSNDLNDVFVRYWELETNLSFRDSEVRPKKGVYLGNNFQVAGYLMGGSVKDFKVQPDLRFYVPISKKVTLAWRGSVGFLFPQDYGSTLTHSVPETSDLQLLYFRAFFSGGSTSNRGYPYRGVGPHGIAPFFAPAIATANSLRDECNQASPNYNEAVCAVPLGGLSLWESSLELRFDLFGALGAAVFLDGSDVSRRSMNLRLNYPHFSTGAGIRVDTPVGAIRADLGYRIPGLQKLGGQLDPAVDGDPGDFWGAPITLSIGVGEAF